MTNEHQASDAKEKKPTPFGIRLKTARESLNLERKEVAKQLRLPEKVILMMEKERYSPDLPVTFIRGYIRSYGKFLQLPEHEIVKALEPIKQKHQPAPGLITPLDTLSLKPVTSDTYFMQVFTYLVIITLVGLVGVWSYSHYTQIQNPIIAEANIMPVNAPTREETKPAVPAADHTLPTTPLTAFQAPSDAKEIQLATKIKTSNPEDDPDTSQDDDTDSSNESDQTDMSAD